MAEKLWGGRFKKKTDRDFFEFQKSIHYDYKLAEFDIYHSLVHISALRSAGILTTDEEIKLATALREILKSVKKSKFKPNPDSEDIHSDIQNKIMKKTGKLALKLHALRSRNDQVVFDEKIYCLNQYVYILKLLSALLEVVFNKAEEYRDNFFPGYTHMQRAQVIYFSEYLFTYAQMFMRDYERLTTFQEEIKIFIGAGALAGTPLKSEYYQRAISIAGVVKKHFEELQSPMDSISDRDFIIEFLSVLSILQMHLSRISEDLILYSTKEYNFIDLPEELCTGSSLMPHKKNPDFLELVRGYTGKIYGNLISVLTLMKGLPLAYNRDMQLDKEPLFSSIEIIKEEVKIMTKLIAGLKLKEENVNLALQDETLYATEIAEFLTMEKKIPFRKAHDIVGKLIRYSEDKKIGIKEMSDKLLKTFCKELNQNSLIKIMTPQYAVSSRKSASTKSSRMKLH